MADKIDELFKIISKLEGRISDLKSELSRLESDLEDLEHEIYDLEEEATPMFESIEDQMKYEHFNNVSFQYTLDQIEKLLP